jgi:GNAT superfamily N-acetyltransferase
MWSAVPAENCRKFDVSAYDHAALPGGSAMPIKMETANPASDADHDAIFRPLLAFNETRATADYEPFAIRLRDDAGDIVGGLFARRFYRWLFVELLFVPDAARRMGLGSTMLLQAEQYAREKGCVGVWLDTFSFQAPNFYPKLGFTRFGALEDYPPGSTRFFFQKRFDGV